MDRHTSPQSNGSPCSATTPSTSLSDRSLDDVRDLYRAVLRSVAPNQAGPTTDSGPALISVLVRDLKPILCPSFLPSPLFSKLMATFIEDPPASPLNGAVPNAPDPATERVDVTKVFATIACCVQGDLDAKLAFVFDLFAQRSARCEGGVLTATHGDVVTAKNLERMLEALWKLGDLQTWTAPPAPAPATDVCSSIPVPSDLRVLVESAPRDGTDGETTFPAFLEWIRSTPATLHLLDKLEHMTRSTDGPRLAQHECDLVRDAVHATLLGPGDRVCVISKRWWTVWCEHARYSDSHDILVETASDADLAIPPGPIDNDDLLDRSIDNAAAVFSLGPPDDVGLGDRAVLTLTRTSMHHHLLPNLAEGIDYVTVPRAVWDHLSAWYGGGPCIERALVPRLVRRGSLTGDRPTTSRATLTRHRQADCVVELYPTCLTVAIDESVLPDAAGAPRSVRLVVGNDVPLAAVVEYVHVVFPGLKTVAWNFARDGSAVLDLTTAHHHPIQILGLGKLPILTVARQDPDRPWPVSSSASSLPLLQEPSADVTAPSRSDAATSPGIPSHSGGTTVTVDGQRGDGLIGLDNLGNSCFFGSAVQLLSSVALFVDFSSTIKRMWIPPPPLAPGAPSTPRSRTRNGTETSTASKSSAAAAPDKSSGLLPPGGTESPSSSRASSVRSFKRTSESLSPKKLLHEVTSRFPDFGDYMQHDAQELLSCLLDELHEQLNSVASPKPTVTYPDDTSGMPLDDVARVWWANHVRRENSPVVALFQGQFQSLIECTVCGHATRSFPPFLFLSVPLPQTNQRLLDVTVVTVASEKPVKYRVRVRRRGTVADVMARLRELDPGLEGRCLIRDRDRIVVYEVERSVTSPAMNASPSFMDLVSHQAAPRSRTVSAASGLGATLSKSPSMASVTAAGHDWMRIYILHRTAKAEWRLLGKRTVKHCIVGLPLIMTPAKDMTQLDLYELVQQRFAKRLALGAPLTPLTPPTPTAPASSPLSPLSLNLFRGRGKSRPRSPLAAPLSSPRSATPPSPTSSQSTGTLVPASPSSTPSGTPTPIKLFPFILRAVDRTGKQCGRCPAISGCHGCELKPLPVPLNATKHDSYVIEWHKSVKLSLLEDEHEHASFTSETIDHAASTSGVALEDVLASYVEAEDVPDFDCAKCQQRQRARKRETIYRLPPVLLVHVKRFHFDVAGSSKNACAIAVPWRNVNLAPYTTHGAGKSMYDMISLINHLGDFEGGHYFTAARRGDVWHVFDDDAVHVAAATDPITSRDVYVLCLQRQGVAMDEVMRAWVKEVAELLMPPPGTHKVNGGVPVTGAPPSESSRKTRAGGRKTAV
ncbi:hypothetical protein AMAG_04101 [Allomyces macrogynus ATCC 38327]|uniref:Uncharacterized protein n=1 Tax=Allomyces macrogynus (strain ATCC 38327) TaxID=578462 RepID=A0A0L0S864_ALLM3|nr:hypothetical protein AMAG_04101 [Allomyces macrogynus ATCC 38327]|eukprot:KNE58534.1 hypothetical protein AMAG_04101 [Allomyces macrogynus ATCC 38327]